MRTIFNILFLLVLTMTSEGQDKNVFASSPVRSEQTGDVQFNNNSSHVIRVINASKLKRIPAVIRDLSLALNESGLQEKYLSDKRDLTIYLYDVTYPSFEISAVVQYFPNDTMYRLKLNRLNEQATDMALAATMIHEIMHCILMDTYQRALYGEQKAIDNIRRFELRKNNSTSDPGIDFFDSMNSGNEGQHELISCLLYPQMVSLLERFAVIHKKGFINKKTPGRMMWTGLQNTNPYKKLSDRDKRLIVTTILAEKKIDDEIN